MFKCTYVYSYDQNPQSYADMFLKNVWCTIRLILDREGDKKKSNAIYMLMIWLEVRDGDIMRFFFLRRDEIRIWMNI